MSKHNITLDEIMERIEQLPTEILREIAVEIARCKTRTDLMGVMIKWQVVD